MDFDDFITLVFFLIFIVSPFLKRKKTKNAGKPVKSEQSGFSVLGKIREVLKEAAREMEAQAKQAQKKKGAGQNKRHRELKKQPMDPAGEKPARQTFWDEIDDREDVDIQAIEQSESVDGKPLFIPIKNKPEKKTPRLQKTRESKPADVNSLGHDTLQPSGSGPGPVQLPSRARGLQKAVIWSEILGKPVALRD